MTGDLYAPRPARVTVDGSDQRPCLVHGVAVTAIREEWLVEDRWWSLESIRRHYFELALADGRCLVVFRERGNWFEQRA